MQYIPQRGLYTYFRYNDLQTVMVVMNLGQDEMTLDPGRFSERIKGFTKAKNIITSSGYSLTDKWKIPAKTIWILELGK